MVAKPNAKQQWVSKFTSKFLPYGKNMQRWKLQTQAKCPWCSCLIEDKDHIIRCAVASAKARWNKALMELDNWMQVAKMHPQLRQDIISGLQHWYAGTTPQRVSMDGLTAGKIQDSLGWGIAFEGCIVSRWREE